MPPPCAILERRVMFVSEGAPLTGGRCSGDEEISIETILQAMKPDAVVRRPPEISRICMMEQMEGGVHGGFISSTDKGLVVLYAGHYQPGSGSSSSGCYLVYDASSNSLHVVPQLPDPYPFSALGLGAAILSCGNGNYVLAELLTSSTFGFPDGALYLWHWPNPKQGQWIRKDVSLPPQVLAPTYRIDVAFSYGNSSVCWVDLLAGILICNLLKSPEPEFTFVPLPPGYSIDVSDRRWPRPRPRPQEFRTMGCVNGVIKFVAIVGYNEKIDRKDLIMKSWTLSSDLKVWKAGNPLAVSDLWGSKSFSERNLPKVAPSFPVISTTESEIFYVMLNDVDRVPTRNMWGNVVAVDIKTKARYMLSVDPTQKKVLHSTKVLTNNVTSLYPQLVASEFNAYMLGSKGCQEGLEASKAGASRKHIKPDFVYH